MSKIDYDPDEYSCAWENMLHEFKEKWFPGYPCYSYMFEPEENGEDPWLGFGGNPHTYGRSKNKEDETIIKFIEEKLSARGLEVKSSDDGVATLNRLIFVIDLNIIIYKLDEMDYHEEIYQAPISDPASLDTAISEAIQAYYQARNEAGYS